MVGIECRSGRINGGIDSPTAILEYDLMEDLFRRSRPSMRDGTFEFDGRCRG